jgi:hypothetical protein
VPLSGNSCGSPRDAGAKGGHCGWRRPFVSLILSPDALSSQQFEEFCEQEHDGGRLRVEPWALEKLAPEGGVRSEEAIFLLSLSWRTEGFGGEDACYLHRPEPGVVELWVEGSITGLERIKGGVAARIESDATDDQEIGRTLLYALWASKLGFSHPDGLVVEGALKQRDWDLVELALLDQHGLVDWKAVPDPRGLLQLAHELVLNPACRGRAARRCHANCPSGRPHSMDLDPTRGLWRCGYCKIGGGLDELRATAELRNGADSRPHQQERGGAARGSVAPRSNETETVHLLVTEYECVGAGSILDDGDHLKVFAEEAAAERYLSESFERVTESVEQEIRSIESSPHLVFDSPYITWVLWLEVPCEEKSLSAAMQQLTRELEDCDDPEAFLRPMVRDYQGTCYSPEALDHDLSAALVSLVDYLV